MEWFNVNSVDELKKLGKFRDVSNVVKNDIAVMAKVNCRGWQTLYESIVDFRGNILKFTSLNSNMNTVCNNDDSYFTSKANEYIFYLIELDGEVRMRKLGITNKHFSNKKVARDWMKKISMVIHPDKCKSPKAPEAMAKLNSMYNGMIENGK